MTIAEGWLFRAMSWMSPAWPIGAFAYSGGLEWAHEAGYLKDRAASETWLRESLASGALRSDGLAFCHGWQAAHMKDAKDQLFRIAELVLAAQTSSERTLETTAQGAAFRKIAIEANRLLHPEQVERYEKSLDLIAAEDIPYPVAASALFASFDVPLRESGTAFLHSSVSNLVSALQRIVPLGHTDAQQLLVALEAAVEAAVEASVATIQEPLEDLLSSNTLVADIACMRHETQYTRLFRT